MISTFAVPYESCVAVQPVEVGVCPICRDLGEWVAYDAEDTYCWMEHEDDWLYDEATDDFTDNRPELDRVLAWRCPGNDSGDCELYFLSEKDLLEHTHGYV